MSYRWLGLAETDLPHLLNHQQLMLQLGAVLLQLLMAVVLTELL